VLTWYDTINYIDKETEDDMDTPIKPLGDRVVAVREEAKTQTASGIYLPDSSKEKPVVAEVKAVGSDVKNVKEGDKIVYKEYSTTDLKIDGTEYLIVREEDILATVV
jgi:chaperonin 10 Kd subunit